MKRKDLVALDRDRLIEIVLQLTEVNAALAARVAQLEEQLNEPPCKGKSNPDWVKASKPRLTPKPSAKHGHRGFGRKRQQPTKRVEHAADSCPDCGCELSGGWVKRRRQILHVPVVPVEIIEHEIIARRCSKCHKDMVPKVDLSAEVLGKHRVSIGTMSLIATLREQGRLPIETIQWMLDRLHGLQLSVGEIVEILHTVADRGQAIIEQMKKQLRVSPVVHGDETGWRENGQNGYVWTFSTPEIRFFLRLPSRSGKVVIEILGDDFLGCLVSDFFAGYNRMLGLHQRCWVHLLRDVRALVELYPENEELKAWVEGVRGLYHRAKHFRGRDPANRQRVQGYFETMLLRLCQPFIKKAVPHRVLSERIERFLPELFVFVADPRVPSDNNAAERSLRPLVVARKISGGTRSEKGSNTRMTLASLVGTWNLRNVDLLQAFTKLMVSPQV